MSEVGTGAKSVSFCKNDESYFGFGADLSRKVLYKFQRLNLVHRLGTKLTRFAPCQLLSRSEVSVLVIIPI